VPAGNQCVLANYATALVSDAGAPSQDPGGTAPRRAQQLILLGLRDAIVVIARDIGGVVIGSYVVNDALRSLIRNTSPESRVFAAASLLPGTATLLAAYLPAERAADVDPE
jgi:hypothetical protein